MRLEIIDLCDFYFEMIDMNNDKDFKQSNKVKFDVLEEEERERVLEALKINRGAFRGNVEGLCLWESFGESEEAG